MNYRYFLMMIGMIFWCSTSAQIVITPINPNPEIFFLDQALAVNLFNPTTNDVKGRIEMTVEDASHRPVIKITSLPIYLAAGSTLSRGQITWQPSNLNFGDNQLAAMLRQSTQLPTGSFIFCYRFLENTNQQLLGLHCQESNTLFFQPPELISPYDEEVVEMPFPILTWQAPLPMLAGHITYDLKLVNLPAHQAPQQALAANVPLLQQKGLNRNTLVYPTNALPLEEGKSYTWQIAAYYKGIPIGQTEIWVFHYKTPKETNPNIPITESYRFAKVQADGTYYLAQDTLFLAFDNRNYKEKLSYQIKANNAVKKSIEKLPEISLSPGLNKVDIDLKNLGLEDGERYLLYIQEDNQTKLLEFIYSSAQK